jgi:5-methylcytosine-specific restriction protein A
MKVRDSLKPHKKLRVIDLVAAAGVDIGSWAESGKGPVKVPASNPSRCYDWAFIEHGKVVVLNVWHSEIQEQDGQVWCDLNPRAYSQKGKSATALPPSGRGALAKRALHMDHAIIYAFDNQMPIRLIVGEGPQRDISNPESKTASRMKLRLLDPEPWSVQEYNKETGACRLSRGLAPRYVDQFSMPGQQLPKQHEVIEKIWERNPKVRDAALLRAAGKCELCHQIGFSTAKGVYLETHHVIPLSEKGVDHEQNVVALCPNDHREAHQGVRRDAIRTRLLTKLAEIYVH